MDNEVIKKKFYELRRQKGLSWADLTAKAGVKDYHNIANWLNTKGLTLATLEKLASLVDCAPWELLQPEPEPEQPQDDSQDGSQDEQPPQPAKIICPHCGKELYLIPADSQDASQDDK